MDVLHDRRVGDVAEDVRLHLFGEFAREMRHVGEAAAEHDDIGIEQIDHHGETAGHAIGVAREGGLSTSVAGGGSHREAARVTRAYSIAILREGGTREHRLEAAMLAAPAEWAGYLVGLRPGQGRMAPLSGDTVVAFQHFSFDHHSTAAAGADDDAEYRVCPHAGAIDRLAQRETVGVVFHAYLVPEQARDIAVERMAIEGERIRVLDEPGCRADDAGNADPDACLTAEFRFRLLDQARDRVQSCTVGVGCRDAPAEHRSAFRVDRGNLDLGAAQVHADAIFCHGARVPGAERRLKLRLLCEDGESMTETVLDLKNLQCPLPVLKANRALRGLAPGEQLRVLATDPAAVDDFRAFCRETGHALLAWSEDGGVFSFLIRRRAEEPTKRES